MRSKYCIIVLVRSDAGKNEETRFEDALVIPLVIVDEVFVFLFWLALQLLLFFIGMDFGSIPVLHMNYYAWRVIYHLGELVFLLNLTAQDDKLDYCS